MIMLKQVFSLAFMAILFFTTIPSFAETNAEITYTEVDGFSNGIIIRRTIDFINYLRNKRVNCTGPNEIVMRCPHICPPETCESKYERYNCPRILIRIKTINCRPACRCKPGYFRNITKHCVPEDECLPQCPANEEYAQCSSFPCKPQTCSQLGFPLNCTALADDLQCQDKPGCVCIDGYVRNNEGVCIPKNDCHACGDDPNAVSGCGINCGKRCSDIGRKGRFSSDICEYNGCDCKDGYFFDGNTNKCVMPNDCTPTCEQNEVYSDCIQGQCGPKNCSQLGKPIPCALIDSESCIKGCICNDNYVRDNNGTCIPKDKCLLSSTTSSTTSRPTTSTSTPQTNIETDLNELDKGNLAFNGELIYQMVQSKLGQSFVVSGLSALIPFSELALYAFGSTLEQLLRLINLKNKDEIRQAFPKLLQNFQGQTSVTFSIANKFYGNKNYPLSDTFKREAQTVFNSEGENVDFSNPVGAANIINKWVANNTNNLIQNLISPDMLNDNTELVCVNALYFLGNWRSQFNPNKTTNRDFYIAPNKTKSIPTMYQQGTFNYGEDSNLNAQVIELDYKGGNFSCVIWLPKTIDGLPSMVNKLRDPDTFSNSMNSLSRETVKVYLPKMDIATDLNLVDQMKKVNVTSIFNSNTSELKGILKTNVPLSVSDAIQKARIKLDETGTEAAAATAVIATRTAAVELPPEIKIFSAYHPYLFCIIFHKNILVFCGVFQGDK